MNVDARMVGADVICNEREESKQLHSVVAFALTLLLLASWNQLSKEEEKKELPPPPPTIDSKTPS
jgi:hypothetical protein